MESGNGRSDNAHFRGIAAARAVTCACAVLLTSDSQWNSIMYICGPITRSERYLQHFWNRALTGAALRRREKGRGAQNGSAATSRSFS